MKPCPKCGEPRGTQAYCDPCFSAYSAERKKARQVTDEWEYLYLWPSPDLPTDWRRDAACLGNPEPFFPSQGDNGNAAQAICRVCPVLEACREWTLAVPPSIVQHGIWAGMNRRDRARARLKDAS